MTNLNSLHAFEEFKSELNLFFSIINATYLLLHNCITLIGNSLGYF